MKYCRYCCTVSRSDNWKRTCMMSEPSAMRIETASWPRNDLLMIWHIFSPHSPRCQLSQFDPVIFFTQLPAERQEKSRREGEVDCRNERVLIIHVSSICKDFEMKLSISLHMIPTKTRQNPCCYLTLVSFSKP